MPDASCKRVQESREEYWTFPIAPPPLKCGEIQVWRVDTTVPDRDLLLHRASLLLSPDEAARARALRRDQPRAEFIAGRACLRLLLAHALQCGPHDLHFGRGRHGKPYLHSHAQGPHFNVAHSGGLVVVALAESPVGIDVERSGRQTEALEIARSNFHDTEVSYLEAAAGEEELIRRFFHLWTGKEACLKATGEGLTRSLKSFSLAGLLNDREIQKVSCHVVLGDEPSRMNLRYLNVAEDFIAALAGTQSLVDIRFIDAKDILMMDLDAGKDGCTVGNVLPVTYRLEP